ncbi:MAG: glucose-1-phosphate cytidylyltransferase [Bacteroidetes bacterium GWF2_42_66]|nr:MAG: glucose-1-phosphate cytidylyltransferase [Bacteroidetes bacterium GWA2_42_15]OFX96315.1 MAG: glucose-1-phosphate cytidylyltransferase [Bacteroidetes bacterium GWE2_42_39]OFY46354.1 MAG: glucose-1-phosphate cytidylyltransferase [Bacteroidetes bacterium GWF2_42_66]HAZ03476.1 glucose-1-phosphate cytidylyltransferase [Marinilabiliales bacterium]HBL78260.1 glucose-1-phosphate cytidylyltransferase [Prolixibacteraceae bacterium]
MKTIILAGGLGTRLSEYTQLIPKPMVEIGGKPILWHIMNIYSKYGFNDFIIALGYKGEVIKEYFLNYYALNNNFSVNLSDGAISYIEEKKTKWRVSLVDTGDNSMTGGRVKRLKNLVDNEPFLLTYGDAVSSIDINKLVAFHKEHGKIGTVTAVHPPARFGELVIDDHNSVTSFEEKPQTKQDWINGGFFVFQPEFFDYIENDSTFLEKEPLENLAREGNLQSFMHDGFWQSMDTVRDRNLLEKLWTENKENKPW